MPSFFIMNHLDIQKLRDLPIEGVAERLALHVAHHKSLCPFHDDRHPSLSYRQRSNTFRCFVCGAHGNTIDLVMRHLNLGFKEACQWLASAESIIMNESKPQAAPPQQAAFNASRYERYFDKPWLSSEAKRFLFTERRLNPIVVQWCRLTSWTSRDGTPWLQTPFYSTDRKLIGVQNRNLAIAHGGNNTTQQPKFRFPQGSQCGIYNLPVLSMAKPEEDIYITEGCSDCWAMLSAGHKAIAVPSATLLTPANARLLKKATEEMGVRWHMYPDADLPGEKLFMQLQELLPGIERHRLPPEHKDFADYYAKSTAN